MDSLPSLLCINLASATRRWNHIEREVEKHIPEATLVRMDAVDWRTLPPDLPDVPVTLFSRYLLAFPQQQLVVRASHRQLDTLSTVAIFLSHVKCWQWLLDHPKEPYVLILEDDACFETGFRASWQQNIEPLLKQSKQWDMLVLGFFADMGNASVSVMPETQPPITTMTVPHFFGAHAYMITQQGAQILKKHAFPLDHQVDGLFLTLHQLGLLRLHMLRQSVVSQCMNTVNREGSWHTHTTVDEAATNARMLIRKMPKAAKIFLGLVVLVALAGWVMWFTISCDKKAKVP